MLGSLWSRLKGFAPLFFIAMGLLSWRITAPYGWLAPWIISAMLFFAVLNMPPSAAAPRPKHLLLFVLQIAIGGRLYFILSAWDHVIATSLLHVLSRTSGCRWRGAMTSLMDGDTGFATGYTIVTHGLICLVAPSYSPYLIRTAICPSGRSQGR